MALRSALPLLVSLAWLAACPASKPTGPVDAGAGAAPPKKADGPKRPPFPNMATAAYGQAVLDARLRESLAGAAGTPSTTKIDDVLAALHEIAPGSEQRAAELALAAYKAAANDVQRGTAIALLSAALVLEPTVEGYKERLTDAYGLSSYAGTVDSSDAVGQGARALVDAAAGAAEQSRRLVELVFNTPQASNEARIFLALARKAAGVRDTDAVAADLQKAIEQRPTGVRARALLAELYLDLGLADEAIAAASAKEALDAQGQRAPWLRALEGRALVVNGKVAEGIAVLREIESKLDEGRRGDVLYWLGRSLSQSDAWQSEVPPIAATLGARPGFGKEAMTLEALTALLGGDFAKARATLEPLARGPAQLAVDVDLTWLLVDACAGLGDAACVAEHGRRALALDGDEARLARARAQALVTANGATGGVPPAAPSPSLTDLQREAHRLSPFDDKLAAAVGEPVVAGGAHAALRLRAARKAVVRGAPQLARTAVAKIADCRACLAVEAVALSGKEAADLAVKAVALSSSPPLAETDLLVVVNALGGWSDDKTRKALDAVAALPDAKRESVAKAITQARADHKNPDARKRRDAEDHK